MNIDAHLDGIVEDAGADSEGLVEMKWYVVTGIRKQVGTGYASHLEKGCGEGASPFSKT